MASSVVSGLASGMDTQGIIDKMIQIERQPIDRLQAKKDTVSTQIAAWQTANTRLLAVKEKIDTLVKPSTFDAKTFTTGDDTLIKGSANSSASSGIYYVTVNATARAEQQKSQGYADTTSTRVGTGKITITVGSGAPKEILVTDANNTLEGLKNAINNADAGVAAAIVNDGDATNPYRLVITSKTSGESGAVTVGSTLSGGTAPTLSIMQAARNASVTLGQGEGALTVSKSANTITDLIPGVTLNLQKDDASKTVTITLENNPEEVKKAIKEFVEQYNNLTDFMNQQSKFDSASNKGGPLMGDTTLQAIQSDLINRVFSPISDKSAKYIMLSQVGITSMSSDNKLTIDDSVLDEVIADSPEHLKRLFSTMGTADSTFVSLSSAKAETKETNTGYAVNITTAATQTRVTSGVAQTSNLGQDETISVNGKDITLSSGLTPTQVIARINEFKNSTGVTASRTGIDGTGSGDYLTLTASAYGSSKVIKVVSNTSNGGTVPNNATSGFGTVQIVQSSVKGEAGTGTGGVTTSGSDFISRITAGVALTKTIGKDQTITVNGKVIALTMNMTGQQVADKINEYTGTTGVVASRTDINGQGTGDYLTLTATQSGSPKTITVRSGVSNGGDDPTDDTDGFGRNELVVGSSSGESGTGTGTIGQDVAGTINGELATGRGQILTGNDGNANTDGLALKITATTMGDLGKITVSKGIGALFSEYLDNVTQAKTGAVSSSKDLLTTQTTSIDEEIKMWEDRVTRKREFLVTKFALMEGAMSRLQGQGSSLSSSLASASAGWRL